MLPPTLRCESLIGPTVTHGHFLLLPLLFIYSFESKPLLFPSHSILFLPPALSFTPPSLFLMVCHCANEEEQEEKGEMNLGHRRPCISSLGHNKTEIDLWFASCAVPLRSRWMGEWTDGQTRTHSQQSWSKKKKNKTVYPPPGPSIRRTKQQVRPRRGSPPSHFCSQLQTLPKCLKIQLRALPLHQLTVSYINLLPRCCTYSIPLLIFLKCKEEY